MRRRDWRRKRTRQGQSTTMTYDDDSITMMRVLRFRRRRRRRMRRDRRRTRAELWSIIRSTSQDAIDQATISEQKESNGTIVVVDDLQ